MSKERSERVGPVHVHVRCPDGPTRGVVVLVHGICLSGRVWHRWAEQLANRGIESWALDLRGHGQSDGKDAVGKLRIEDYVDDVRSVLDAAGASTIVGHDMGGLVAQELATRVELRGLALVGSIAPRGIAGASNLLLFWRELRPRYVKAMLRGKAWQPTEADFAALACGKLDDEGKRDVLSWLGPESGVAAREMSIAGVPVDETKVRCPVIVAATTLDILTPPARQRLIASHYRADYVEFAQHAHFPMLEPGWERPAAVVARWLEEAARLGEGSKASIARIGAARRANATASPIPGATSTPIPGATPAPPAAEKPAAPQVVAAPSAAPASPSTPTNGQNGRSSIPPTAGE